MVQYSEAKKIANEIIEKRTCDKESMNEWMEEAKDLSKICSELALEIENEGVLQIVDALRQEKYEKLKNMEKDIKYFKLKFNIAYNYFKKKIKI